MDELIEQLKNLFESISCLCAEGPEVMTKWQLTEKIQSEAMFGYALCKSNLTSRPSGGEKACTCPFPTFTHKCKHNIGVACTYP